MDISRTALSSLLPRERSRAQIPFPIPFERLPRKLHRTPRFPQSTLLVFHNPRSSFSTLYTSSHSAYFSSLLLRMRSRAQIPYTSSLARDLAPKFPSPPFPSNACHVGFTALPVFHTPHYCLSRQPFMLAVKSTFLKLSADFKSYISWRCLATLKFFPKTLKQRLKWS